MNVGCCCALVALSALLPTARPALAEAAPCPPGGIRITVPAGHRLVSVMIDDASGVRVRNLLSLQPVEPFGGSPSNGALQTLNVPWDGRDDDGVAVPPGRYSAHGVSSPGLGARYERSFYNPGDPPWSGYPNSHWGANHGDAVAIACVGAGDTSAWRTVIGCSMSEGTDFCFAVGKNDRKVLGWQQPWGGCRGLAIRDGHLYAGFGQGLRHIEVGSGRTLGWRRPAGTIPEVKLEGWIWAVAAGATNVAVVTADDKGNGPQLQILNRESGRITAATNLAALCHLAVGPGDVLHAVAAGGTGVLRVAWNAAPLPPLALPGLEKPGPLAFDAAGNLYVADLGPDYRVKVFARNGALLRSVGRAGGARRGYAYERDGLYRLLGLAVDERGFLWTTEGGHPRRQAVWDARGRLVKEFVGSTGYGASGAYVHDQDPERAGLCDVLLRSNPSSMQDYRVDRFVYSGARPDSPFALEAGITYGAFFARHQMFRSETSGRQREYLIQTSRGFPVIFLEKGGDYRPVAAMWTKYVHADSCPWSRAEDPDGTVYLWSDLNEDERLQDDEIAVPPGAAGQGCGWTFPMPQSLELYNGGYAIKPTRFTPAGAPVYGEAGWTRLAGGGLERALAAIQQDPNRPERMNHFMVRVGRHLYTSYGDWPTYFTGKHVWTDLAGNVVATRRFAGSAVHGSIAYGKPPAPGETLGELFVSGVAHVSDDLGSVMALHGDQGQVYFFTEDGILAGSLFRDWRDSPAKPGEHAVRGADWTNVTMEQEAFCGWFAKQSDGKYRYLFGHTTANIVEVIGLDRVRRLPPCPIEVAQAP